MMRSDYTPTGGLIEDEPDALVAVEEAEGGQELEEHVTGRR